MPPIKIILINIYADQNLSPLYHFDRLWGKREANMSGPEFRGGLSLRFLCQCRYAANSAVREYSQIIKDLVYTHAFACIYTYTPLNTQTSVDEIIML